MHYFGNHSVFPDGTDDGTHFIRCPGFKETNESLEELLTFPDTTKIFNELINRYALRSGVSCVQPKVLLEATQRGTLTSSAGYIVKTGGTNYPKLPANEYFCMTAAKRAGLLVAEFHLAENGGLFVMRRFDVAPDEASISFYWDNPQIVERVADAVMETQQLIPEYGKVRPGFREEGSG